MKKLILMTLAAATLALGGCNTVKTRIEEKSAVFNSLDPQTQARIRQGLVDVGYTTDMVYIAMGKPDEVKDRVTADGHETTWIYNSYWQEYEGTRVVGFHRSVYYDPRARAYRVYFEPVRTDLYRDRAEQRTRIFFKDDHVTSIEAAKD